MVFKITKYADSLLDSLNSMDGWPDKVRTMQKIGLASPMVVRLTSKLYQIFRNLTVKDQNIHHST